MFEEIVYRGYGRHQRKGGGFSTLGVKSEKDYEKALADGWFKTLPEAIAAHDNKKTPAPASILEVKSEAAPVPADNTQPTRAELEQKARELNVKFDGRTSDAKLQERIEEAL